MPSSVFGLATFPSTRASKDGASSATAMSVENGEPEILKRHGNSAGQPRGSRQLRCDSIQPWCELGCVGGSGLGCCKLSENHSGWFRAGW